MVSNLRLQASCLKGNVLLTMSLAEVSGKTPIRMEQEITVVGSENYTLLVDLRVKPGGNLLMAILFSGSPTPSEVIAK